MKYVITESQYKLLLEDEEQKILKIPNLDYFGNWKTMQKFLEKRGNPPYGIKGNLDLRFANIKSLGNLVYVEGDLDLADTDIESLGNLESVGGYLDLIGTPIQSLGNLESVGGFLSLTQSDIESLGKLEYVGGSLDLFNTPLSYMYTKDEIREIIDVGGEIYM